jgi:hypothetical protein
MPEAAMDEESPPAFPVRSIGGAWQVAVRDAKAHSEPMKDRADRNLCSRVALSDLPQPL